MRPRNAHQDATRTRVAKPRHVGGKRLVSRAAQRMFDRRDRRTGRAGRIEKALALGRKIALHRKNRFHSILSTSIS
jgi:hypothetical protein